jgi:hypothetical protein
MRLMRMRAQLIQQQWLASSIRPQASGLKHPAMHGEAAWMTG